MTDQLLFQTYLLLLKSTIEVYIHGTLESTNPSVRKELHNSLNSTITMQKDTYEEMTKMGWYAVQNISSKEIQKTKTKLGC